MLIITMLAVTHPSGQVVKGGNKQLPMLELSGKVKKIQLLTGDKGSYNPIVISLEMNLLNKGNVPIILLRDQPICINANVTKTLLDMKNESNFVYNLASSSDFVSANEWKEFKRELNKDIPPSTMTSIVSPMNSITYGYDLRLNLPQEERSLNSYRSELSFKQLQELSPVLLRLSGCDFRNYGIENESSKNRSDFANQLKKRWHQYGALWLDLIDSEPIELDFSSANFGT